MTITTLLFASYADAMGRDAVTLTLAPGATVADAVAALRRLPGGARLPANPLVAVNLEYVRDNRSLAAGDELAVIPPVAGG